MVRKAIKKYLQERRSLGFKLNDAERLLFQFANYLEEHKTTIITQELAMKWACISNKCQPKYWAQRLSTVRLFARYYSAIDPRTEIPAQGLLPFKNRRTTPYIYTENQLLSLIKAARTLYSKTGLRASTFVTLFSLLIVTGMRIGEVVGLDREDVDLEEGVLLVRKAKHDRRRLIPVHSSTVKALRRYVRYRDKIHPKPKTASFLVSEAGIRLTASMVRWNFNKLSCQIGLRDPSDSSGPRIHDIRHTWAVHTVQNWYRQGKNVDKLLPQLAVYLGHRVLNCTYWYMTATPELLQLAAKRSAERINYEEESRIPCNVRGVFHRSSYASATGKSPHYI
jgi:integrase